MSLKLSIVTPLKKLVTDLEIESVSLPAFMGELTILEEHEALVSTLETGILTYKEKATGKEKKLSISWGYCEIMGANISVLAETAEVRENINFERAKKSLENSKEQIAKTEDIKVVAKHLSKIKKAEARLNLN